MTDLYAAYGSNLHHARMLARCDGAVPLGSAIMPGWRLAVNRYATIERDAAASVPFGLWRVTPRHIKSLDRAEGVAMRVYERITLDVPGYGNAWCYVEIGFRRGPPRPDYVDHLRHGYREFGLDSSVLDEALARCLATTASRRVM